MAFRRFLCSYIVIFIIPLILSFYIYNENIKAIEANIQEAGLAALENGIVTLDSRFSEMESFATTFSLDQQAVDFAKRESPYVDGSIPTTINDMRRKLVPATYANQFISDMFLYYVESDVVITPNASYLRLDRYYGDFFLYGDYSQPEFESLLHTGSFYKAYLPCDYLMSRKYYSVNLPVENDRGFLFVHTFPYGQVSKAQIVMVVQEKAVSASLMGVTEEWNSDIYILNSEQELFFTTEDKSFVELSPEIPMLAADEPFSRCTFNGEAVILVRATSAFNGWTYVMKIPQQVVGERLSHVKALLYGYVALTVAIGIALALFFTKRSTKPLSGMIALLDGQEQVFGDERLKRDEYSYITSSIRNLYRNNEDLKGSLDRQKPLMRATFVEKLLTGWFDDREEIVWFASQLDFQPLSGKLLVLIARLDFSGEERDNALMDTINMIKSVCEKTLSAEFHTDVYYCDTDFDRRVIILGVPEESPEAVQQAMSRVLQEISDEVEEEFGIAVQFGAGCLVDDYTEISRSYALAEECVPYLSVLRGQAVLWPDSLPKGAKSYYYPLNLESRLMNAVRARDGEDIQKTMRILYRENFEQETMTPEMTELFFSDLRATALKLCEALAMEDEEQRASLRKSVFAIDFQTATVERAFYQLEELLLQLGEAFQSGRSQKNCRLVELVQEYVEQNFHDQQLNLNDVADRLGITPSYLSQLFKDVSGMKFSHYLESLRLDKACEYLREQMPVNRVAEQVGYNSAYVFRTAFKRNKGVSPSEYRKEYIHKDIVDK